MKVLFDHPNPFLLAHGGFQTQIEQTKKALEDIGVEVEWLRWWDDQQKGNLIHYFGKPDLSYVDFAHSKGYKIVTSLIISGTTAKTAVLLVLQKIISRSLIKLKMRRICELMRWESLRRSDAIIFLTELEAETGKQLWMLDPQKTHIIPNGVREEFIVAGKQEKKEKGEHLLYVATIRDLKRNVEVALAAGRAEVPIKFLGAPYSKTDPYYIKFLEAIKAAAPFAKYQGAAPTIKDLINEYQKARGVLLLSKMEGLSLAVLEAGAMGIPVLLSKRPWATREYGSEVTYANIDNIEREAQDIRSFWDKANQLPNIKNVLSWADIAVRLKDVYTRL
jgi:glycosyltransferase involved in cell wall biosynthesis